MYAIKNVMPEKKTLPIFFVEIPKIVHITPTTTYTGRCVEFKINHAFLNPNKCDNITPKNNKVIIALHVFLPI